jgi:predicted O-methyltransferase YrrM
MVEVGVYHGGSARFIADTLLASRRRPRLYLCDTFAGHARTDPELDTTHHNAHKFEDANVDDTAAYVADYEKAQVVVGDIVETSEKLAEERFAFVHVDVDVYPATDFCLRFFSPRLAEGAVLVIDDYGFLTCPGSKRAADDFIEDHPEFRLFHLLTGQAIIYQSRAN